MFSIAGHDMKIGSKRRRLSDLGSSFDQKGMLVYTRTATKNDGIISPQARFKPAPVQCWCTASPLNYRSQLLRASDITRNSCIHTEGEVILT